MAIQDNLPSLGWVSTLAISILGFFYWCFLFVSNTRSSIASHDKRLDRLESDLAGHLDRLEKKLDKVILHIAGLRNAD